MKQAPLKKGLMWGPCPFCGVAAGELCVTLANNSKSKQRIGMVHVLRKPFTAFERTVWEAAKFNI